MKEAELNRYRIYKREVDRDNWTQIDLDEFLRLTEGRGAYKKGTALKNLKRFDKIRTDFQYFSLDKTRLIKTGF